jgi:phytoene dehydrogenase-like protein
VRYAGDFLNRFIPLHPQVRSLAAAIGCRSEDILPSQTSMAVHVSNMAAASDPTGFSYPVGGPRSLGHALRNVVEVSGGKVVTGASVQEFVFEEEATTNKTQTVKPPQCAGVKLVNGQPIQEYNKIPCVLLITSPMQVKTITNSLWIQ